MNSALSPPTIVTNPKQTLTKYAMVKATGLRSPAVAKQLKILLDLGWIRKYETFRPLRLAASSSSLDL